jgi:hypothetical protein
MSKQNLMLDLKKYILEVFIIFIGISISFMFDNWREKRSDHETAHKHFYSLKANLIQDTLVLSKTIKFSDQLLSNVKKLTYFDKESEVLMDIDTYIDNAASYLGFYSNMTAFEEIKQSAHTYMISNDTLKRAMLSYYTSVIPYCYEWSNVDKMHTMNQLIPEMSLYFPVVPDSLNMVSASEKVKAIKITKLRNLLLTNLVYKQEVVNSLRNTKMVATKLLKRIDDELSNE